MAARADIDVTEWSVVQLARDLIQEWRKRLCILCPYWRSHELSLPASPVRRHDHPSRGDVREALAIVPADQVQAQVEPGGRAGTRQHRAVADVEHIWIDPGQGNRFAKSAAYRQCVVQSRPSSSPAAPSTYAPEQTLMTMAPRSTAARSVPKTASG